MDGTEQVRYWNVGTGSTGTVDLGAGVFYEAAAPGGFIVARAGVLYRQALTGCAHPARLTARRGRDHRRGTAALR